MITAFMLKPDGMTQEYFKQNVSVKELINIFNCTNIKINDKLAEATDILKDNDMFELINFSPLPECSVYMLDILCNDLFHGIENAKN